MGKTKFLIILIVLSFCNGVIITYLLNKQKNKYNTKIKHEAYSSYLVGCTHNTKNKQDFCDKKAKKYVNYWYSDLGEN